LVGLVLALGCTANPRPTGGAPANHPPESEHDLGTIVVGDSISHTFDFVNATDAVLSLDQTKDVTVDCGCTSVGVTPDSIHPNGTAKIVLTVNTANAKGAFAYHCALNWRDATGHPRPHRLTLRGTAVGYLTCTPEVVRAQHKADVGPETVEVTISGSEGIDYSAWSVISDSEHTTVVTAVPTGPRTLKATVRCECPKDVDSFSSALTVSATM